MKIGMVSKPEPCKPHMKALVDRGHEVVCLGTEKVDFPPSYDVFVCRPDSVSHQAFWDASGVKKDGREVIFENSVTKIVKAVEKLESDVRKELESYSREVNRAASVLQDALEPNPLTVEKKLIAAIKEIGLYHPRLAISADQFQTLQDWGLIKSIPKAREAYSMAYSINPTSWPRPFNNIRRSPNFYTYRLWKLSETEGRMKMKTPWDMAAPSHVSQKTLDKVAKLFGFTTVEPSVGRVWPPNAPPEPSALVQAALGGEAELVAIPTTTPVAAAPKPSPAAAEPVLVTTEPVNSPVAIEADSPEAWTKAQQERSAPYSPKTDIRDLLSMLNDALLSLNIVSLKLKPGASGPEYEMEQQVVRKINSIEDIM